MDLLTTNLLLASGAAVASAVLISLLIPLARRLDWLDHPRAHKTHADATPLAGGVAIFISLFIGLALYALFLPGSGATLWSASAPVGWWTALVLGCGIALLTGLADDRQPLSAWRRFLWQAIACGVMIAIGGVQLDDFGRLAWDGVLQLGVLAVPITVFSALGVINAFNMIDGLDGQSGGVFLVCATAVLFLAGQAGAVETQTVLLLAAGAVAGFLAFNARWLWNPQARVFLGDSGSLFLGFLLAWLFIDLGNGPERAFAPITAVWIIGLPLLDTTRLIATRLRAGRSPFDADQAHLHHLLLRRGLSVGQTSLLVTALSAVFAAIGIAMELAQTPEYWRFYGFVATGLLYLYLLKRL